MRVMCTFGVLLCLMAAVAAGHSAPAAADATAVLAAAREALGGEKKLIDVKSFVATGRTRQVRGTNLAAIEFEIYCQLPDKYMRKDEIPAQESEPTASGFNGDGLIQVPPPPEVPAAGARPGAATAPAAPPAAGAKPGAAAVPGTAAAPPAAAPPAAAPPAAAGRTAPPPASGARERPSPAGAAAQPSAAQMAAMMAGMAAGGPGGPQGDPRKARVTTLKQDFVKLTLGLFASSFSSYPLTFSLVGQAEAPQGKADVIDVKGPGTFALKLFINSDSHLPIMISWTMPATNAVLTVPGQPAPENLPPGSIVVQAPAAPPSTAPKEEQAKYAKDMMDLRRQALAGKLVEYRVYYADYRDVGNGIKFPFRLRRAIAGETVEETNFDGFAINKRIDPKRFEALK